MAKIIRYDGNVKSFAIDAVGNERTVFGDTVQSDSLTSNLNSNYFRGFGIFGEGDLVKREDYNGFGFTLSELNTYLYQYGVAQWDSAQEFNKDSITNFNGVLYVSDADLNTGNNPEINGWTGIVDFATTQDAVEGTSETKIMSPKTTDDVIKDLLQKAYPVGSIWESENSTNPLEVLGFGVWDRIMNRRLVGLDETDPDFDTPGKTGGSSSHSHNSDFSVVDKALTTTEMPPHTHEYKDRYYIENSASLSNATFKISTPAGYNGQLGSGDTDSDNDMFLFIDSVTEETGGIPGTGLSAPHSHDITATIDSQIVIQPYHTVYIWVRSS